MRPYVIFSAIRQPISTIFFCLHYIFDYHLIDKYFVQYFTHMYPFLNNQPKIWDAVYGWTTLLKNRNWLILTLILNVSFPVIVFIQLSTLLLESLVFDEVRSINLFIFGFIWKITGKIELGWVVHSFVVWRKE